MHLKEAARLEPQNGLFLSEYGNFAIRHSLVKEAVVTFEKLMKLIYWGDSPETACSILKKVFQLTGDYPTVSSMTPDTDGTHLCLAYVLEEAGKWEAAKIEFDRAIELTGLISRQNAEQLRERLRPLYASHGVIENEHPRGSHPNP